MQTIEKTIRSPYRGSPETYERIKSQLKEKYGVKCANKFDPYTDVMPYSSWLFYGLKVKKHERALKSITYLEVKDEKTGEVKKIRRTVNLFHRNQVEKI